MPFFENAKQFEINGGNFLDVRGNQNNYHYDQSLKVSGQGNTANYVHGQYHNGADNGTHNNAGHMSVIGQGSNAGVALGGANSMPWNYLQSQPNVAPQFGQSYGHLQANAPPPAQAQPYGYGPPNGMFHHSTGHLNPQFPAAPSPPSQPQHYPNGFQPSPPPPQPVAQQYHAPASYFPAHHSQPSINSIPAASNIPPIQIIQNTHQRTGSHTSGSLSPNMVPQQPSQQQPPQQPPQQSAPPPRADNQTTSGANGSLGTPVLQSNPSVSSSTGSVFSGTTLAPQSPQPMAVGSASAVPSPTVTASSPAATTSTAATTAVEPSTPSTSSPVAQGQQGQNPATPTATSDLTELFGVVFKPGAPTPDAILAEEGKKSKKKKKGKFFSRLFKRTSKETALAANA